MHETQYYSRNGKGGITCKLCPRICTIEPGFCGFCGARGMPAGNTQKDEKLYTLNYGKIAALSMDPIEKKPLYCFFPGSQILSAGTFGCNLDCSFCQNSSLVCGGNDTGKRENSFDMISEYADSLEYVSPEELCDAAALRQDNLGLAFTYNEPSVWYEYVYDTSFLLKQKYPDKKAVLVSNGYINQEPLKNLLPFIDAVNFDLKGGDRFYREICKGKQAYTAVRESIRTAADAGCHIEISFLVIDGENSDAETVTGIIDFIASVNPEIPLHINRYFPRRFMTIPQTKRETLESIYGQAKQKLKYVYLGNI
ncbi:radical SAM protein [Brucepastera parasyntrophica]|uniref:radical SAM protein n=1 Tax=Brucepastera parasyntrophica TaxID=2880008 RepID=UPI00210E1607|nr:radical SAM protein [Brucepastera parasyntrophica]ULQ60521.1 radical SAM protein [Brucepastera parasyntrophica]